jgi:hypothetical protein
MWVIQICHKETESETHIHTVVLIYDGPARKSREISEREEKKSEVSDVSNKRGS